MGETNTFHHLTLGLISDDALNYSMDYFIQKLKFKRIAYRETAVDTQHVLMNHQLIIILHKFTTSLSSISEYPDFTVPWNHPGKPDTLVNCAYDASMEVCDVYKAVEKLRSNNVEVIREPKEITTEDGTIVYSVVKSCVGNTVHTLIDKSRYKGVFLPGFTGVNDEEEMDEQFEYKMDHITLCLPRGEAMNTVRWYERCFGMERCLLHRDESVEEGYSLDDIGLRFAVMDYWKCAETALKMKGNSDTVMFVIGEAMTDSPNNANNFLKVQGGGGIHHVGIHTNDLISMVKETRRREIPFQLPPPDYYTESGKHDEIKASGQSVDELADCGILLDTEANVLHKEKKSNTCLMQIFTTSLYMKDGFFLEFLQRDGATGFGSGNISALWKAVESQRRKMQISN